MKRLDGIGTLRRGSLLLLLIFCCQASYSQHTLPPNLPSPPPLPEDLAKSAPPELPPELPDTQQLIDQLKQLDDLLSMSPERLGKLRETIELIERMSPEERETMRIRLSQVTRMTPALRQEIHGLNSLLKPETRTVLSQYWLSLSEEKREEKRCAMKALTEKERSAWLAHKVEMFQAHRDAVFEEMKRQLEKRGGK